MTNIEHIVRVGKRQRSGGDSVRERWPGAAKSMAIKLPTFNFQVPEVAVPEVEIGAKGRNSVRKEEEDARDGAVADDSASDEKQVASERKKRRKRSKRVGEKVNHTIEHRANVRWTRDKPASKSQERQRRGKSTACTTRKQEKPSQSKPLQLKSSKPMQLELNPSQQDLTMTTRHSGEPQMNRAPLLGSHEQPLPLPVRADLWDVDDVCLFVRELGFPTQAFEDYVVDGQILCQLSPEELIARFGLNPAEVFALREAFAQTTQLQLASCALCTIRIEATAAHMKDTNAWQQRGCVNRWLDPFGSQGGVKDKPCQGYKLWFRTLAPLLDAVENMNQEIAGVAPTQIPVLRHSKPRTTVFCRLVPLYGVRRTRTKVIMVRAEEQAAYENAHPERASLDLMRELGVSGRKELVKANKLAGQLDRSGAFNITNHNAFKTEDEKDGPWKAVGTLQSLVIAELVMTFCQDRWPMWANANHISYCLVWKISVSDGSLKLGQHNRIVELVVCSSTFGLRNAPKPNVVPLTLQMQAPKPANLRTPDLAEVMATVTEANEVEQAILINQSDEPVGLAIAVEIDIGQTALFKSLEKMAAFDVMNVAQSYNSSPMTEQEIDEWMNEPSVESREQHVDGFHSFLENQCFDNQRKQDQDQDLEVVEEVDQQPFDQEIAKEQLVLIQEQRSFKPSTCEAVYTSADDPQGGYDDTLSDDTGSTYVSPDVALAEVDESCEDKGFGVERSSHALSFPVTLSRVLSPAAKSSATASLVNAFPKVGSFAVASPAMASPAAKSQRVVSPAAVLPALTSSAVVFPTAVSSKAASSKAASSKAASSKAASSKAASSKAASQAVVSPVTLDCEPLLLQTDLGNNGSYVSNVSSLPSSDFGQNRQLGVPIVTSPSRRLTNHDVSTCSNSIEEDSIGHLGLDTSSTVNGPSFVIEEDSMDDPQNTETLREDDEDNASIEDGSMNNDHSNLGNECSKFDLNQPRFRQAASSSVADVLLLRAGASDPTPVQCNDAAQLVLRDDAVFVESTHARSAVIEMARCETQGSSDVVGYLRNTMSVKRDNLWPVTLTPREEMKGVGLVSTLQKNVCGSLCNPTIGIKFNCADTEEEISKIQSADDLPCNESRLISECSSSTSRSVTSNLDKTAALTHASLEVADKDNSTTALKLTAEDQFDGRCRIVAQPSNTLAPFNIEHDREGCTSSDNICRHESLSYWRAHEPLALTGGDEFNDHYRVVPVNSVLNLDDNANSSSLITQEHSVVASALDSMFAQNAAHFNAVLQEHEYMEHTQYKELGLQGHSEHRFESGYESEHRFDCELQADQQTQDVDNISQAKNGMGLKQDDVDVKKAQELGSNCVEEYLNEPEDYAECKPQSPQTHTQILHVKHKTEHEKLKTNVQHCHILEHCSGSEQDADMNQAEALVNGREQKHDNKLGLCNYSKLSRATRTRVLHQYHQEIEQQDVMELSETEHRLKEPNNGTQAQPQASFPSDSAEYQPTLYPETLSPVSASPVAVAAPPSHYVSKEFTVPNTPTTSRRTDDGECADSLMLTLNVARPLPVGPLPDVSVAALVEPLLPADQPTHEIEARTTVIPIALPPAAQQDFVVGPTGKIRSTLDPVALLSRFANTKCEEQNSHIGFSEATTASSGNQEAALPVPCEGGKLLESLQKIRQLELENQRLMEALTVRHKLDNCHIQQEEAVRLTEQNAKFKREKLKKKGSGNNSGKSERKATLKALKLATAINNHSGIPSNSRNIENELMQEYAAPELVAENTPASTTNNNSAEVGSLIPRRHHTQSASEEHHRISQQNNIALLSLEMAKSVEKTRAIVRALRITSSSVGANPTIGSWCQKFADSGQVLRAQAECLRSTALAWAESCSEGELLCLDAYSERKFQRKLKTLTQVVRDLETALAE